MMGCLAVPNPDSRSVKRDFVRAREGTDPTSSLAVPVPLLLADSSNRLEFRDEGSRGAREQAIERIPTGGARAYAVGR